MTISHYETPLAFTNLWNSWADRRMIDHYLIFCDTIFNRYKDVVKYWLTFNEINCMTLGYWGAWLAGGVIAKNEETNINAAHYQLVASAKAVALGRKINPHFQFGCMLEMAPCYGYTCDPKDAMAAWIDMHEIFVYGDVQCRGKYPAYKLQEWKKKGLHIDLSDDDKKVLKEGCVDFAAFSYYMTRVMTTHDDIIKDATLVNGNLQGGIENPYLQTSQWGWQIDPVGLRYSLNLLYERYDIPVMVVEIGLGALDVIEDGKIHDHYRIQFLKDHIEQMMKAIEEDGVDVLGLYPWGFIDQVSASTGEMAKRYGMIYVNKQDDGSGDMRRIKKDSFYWYKQCIASKGKCL